MTPQNELERLIEEQRLDMLRGHRVRRRDISPLWIVDNRDLMDKKVGPRRKPKAKLRLAADDPRHGTTRGYKAGCKCVRCRAAMSTAAKKRRHDPNHRLEPNDPRHGTHNGYFNWRCRCLACTKANTDYHRERREQRRARLHGES